MAVDAFGNALGNSIVDAAQPAAPQSDLGSGLKVTQAVADSWGNRNIPDAPLARTRFDSLIADGERVTLSANSVKTEPETLADIFYPKNGGSIDWNRGVQLAAGPGYTGGLPKMPEGAQAPTWNMRDASAALLARDRAYAAAAAQKGSSSMTAWDGRSGTESAERTLQTLEAISANPVGAAGYLLGRGIGLDNVAAGQIAVIGALGGDLIGLRAGARVNSLARDADALRRIGANNRSGRYLGVDETINAR